MARVSPTNVKLLDQFVAAVSPIRTDSCTSLEDQLVSGPLLAARFLNPWRESEGTVTLESVRHRPRTSSHSMRSGHQINAPVGIQEKPDATPQGARGAAD